MAPRAGKMLGYATTAALQVAASAAWPLSQISSLFMQACLDAGSAAAGRGLSAAAAETESVLFPEWQILQNRCAACTECNARSADSSTDVQVCHNAAAAGRASEQLLLEWPRLALRFGRAKAALSAAAQGTEQAPASAELWRQRLVLESQHANLQVWLSPPHECL